MKRPCCRSARRKGEDGSSVRVLLLFIAGATLAGGLVLWLARSPQRNPIGQEPKPSQSITAAAPSSDRSIEPSATIPGQALAVKPAAAPPPAALIQTAAALPPPRDASPETRQLVVTLAQLDVTHGPISAEHAAAWKESLNQLAAQGEAALPAIREFLEKNLDLNFDAAESGAQMGFPSLRLALLNTMQNIGGPEALAISLQTLQTTADPGEIAALAKYLGQSADAQQHRDAVLSAAREALGIAASSNWDGRDVAPLFDLLKAYAGANAVADFEKYAGTWFNYTPLMLAQLPDGAGIPSLIRFADISHPPTTLGGDIRQRMLAQVSAQSSDAAEALFRQVSADHILSSAWPGVASALTGRTLELARTLPDTDPAAAAKPQTAGYHIALGNQNYIERPPPEMTAGQVQERIQFIERLLAAATNPYAREQLQGARDKLNARLAEGK